MPQNTTYNPSNLNEFDKNKLNKDACGIEILATASQDTNLDYTFTDDCLILTSVFMVDGAARGDHLTLQIIHPTYGIVFQPISNWRINYKQVYQEMPKANFPARIFTGLTLRIVYHSVGTNDVWICLNLDKDKILI